MHTTFLFSSLYGDVTVASQPVPLKPGQIFVLEEVDAIPATTKIKSLRVGVESIYPTEKESDPITSKKLGNLAEWREKHKQDKEILTITHRGIPICIEIERVDANPVQIWLQGEIE